MIQLKAKIVVCAISFAARDWQNTVRHGAAQASALGATLHLVHVIAPTPWLMRRVMDERALVAYEKDQRGQAERMLAEAAASVDNGVACTVEARVGKPAVQIIAALTESGAGLLVVGADRVTNTQLMVGGAADRLMRLSPVPVLIAGPMPPAPLNTVLVPTGLGPGGAGAVQVALGLAGPTGVVKALHMVALPGVMRAYSGDVLKLRAAMEDTARSELDSHLALTGAGEDTATLEGLLRTNLEAVPADQTILAESRAAKADLICLALGGRGLGPGLLVGRVSSRLIRTLPCPLLALPDRWIEAQRQS